MPLTDRQNALLGYFATIAFDPRVRSVLPRSLGEVTAGAVRAVGRAAYDCMLEDLPAVLKSMARGLAEGATKRAIEEVKPMVNDFFDHVFGKR